MRATVAAWSTMTRSPEGRVLMYGLLSRYCSAINGEMFDLIQLASH